MSLFVGLQRVRRARLEEIDHGGDFYFFEKTTSGLGARPSVGLDCWPGNHSGGESPTRQGWEALQDTRSGPHCCQQSRVRLCLLQEG